MILQPEDPSLIGSYALEDPIPIQKPVIEDRDRSPFRRNKLLVSASLPRIYAF